MEITPELLRYTMKAAAQILILDGEKFLPIYLRIEREIAKLDDVDAAMARARALCGGEDGK